MSYLNQFQIGFDFMPTRGGYFIGNVSSARTYFRWFALGNCIAILSSLATYHQSMAIMDFLEERWDDLVGQMPSKMSYPALDSHEWRIVTGCHPKNTYGTTIMVVLGQEPQIGEEEKPY